MVTFQWRKQADTSLIKWLKLTSATSQSLTPAPATPGRWGPSPAALMRLCRALSQPSGTALRAENAPAVDRRAQAQGMWPFHLEGSLGLEAGPAPEWNVSLLFIASVCMLHIWGKYAHSQIQLHPSVCHRRRKKKCNISWTKSIVIFCS